MKKEKQIGVRVGLPAFFALELEDVYKHTEGAHRALAFPDFVGLLVGIGLDAYRKQNTLALASGASEDSWDWQEKRQDDFETIPVNSGFTGKRIFDEKRL
jgi:hypothetical protein